MLMSEFDTSIYYLAGPQNHLGDFLSRAVELDSDARRSLAILAVCRERWKLKL